MEMRFPRHARDSEMDSSVNGAECPGATTRNPAKMVAIIDLAGKVIEGNEVVGMIASGGLPDMQDEPD